MREQTFRGPDTYAEGYPGRRYCGGCEVVDRAHPRPLEVTGSQAGSDRMTMQY
ncbi:MAG: hypothetical protein ACRDRH_02045 [Pseudonocardia sp.]